jgi:hypothetical protein
MLLQQPHKERGRGDSELEEYIEKKTDVKQDSFYLGYLPESCSIII